MSYKKRIYGLGIWGLGLNYYLFYTPYSGLTKALSGGIFSDIGPVPGVVLLPVSVLAMVLCMFGFITATGWWRYAGRREFFGVRVPFPRRLTFLSGVCMATIVATTTLAFTFGGVSIVLVLVLLRGGVLIIAPVVDAISQRRVRWFSWVAMFVSLLAVLVALGDEGNYKLTPAAVLDVSAYLVAYFFKFRFMTRLAKSDEREAGLRYFVEEQMVASPLLLLALAALAAFGAGDLAEGLRFGFTGFLASRAALAATLVGLFYAGLCVCTTFIFLDRRENTFCVPMHCGSSMLSGVTASYVLAVLYGSPAPSAAQLVGSGLLIVALAFLSPLHHLSLYRDKLVRAFRRSPSKLRPVSGGADASDPGGLRKPATGTVAPLQTAGGEEQRSAISQLFLFVCSGNTCRSPMAAAIGDAEIAARLRAPLEAARRADVLAVSAGLSARVGAPMTPEALEALRSLGIPAGAHAARNLTAEMSHSADKIFCMTQAQRRAVIEMTPLAAFKTQCLDPDGDVEDPAGGSPAEYLNCAARIRALVRLRFDEVGLAGGLQS
jgi:protein-tyrosine-phosphatase